MEKLAPGTNVRIPGGAVATVEEDIQFPDARLVGVVRHGPGQAGGGYRRFKPHELHLADSQPITMLEVPRKQIEPAGRTSRPETDARKEIPMSASAATAPAGNGGGSRPTSKAALMAAYFPNESATVLAEVGGVVDRFGVGTVETWLKAWLFDCEQPLALRNMGADPSALAHIRFEVTNREGHSFLKGPTK